MSAQDQRQGRPSRHTAEPFPRLGQYQLVKPLGRDGVADVFVARRIGPDDVVGDLMVQRLLAEVTRDPQIGERFLASARLAARLDHPAIVRILDVGAVDGVYFLCGEQPPGHSLASVLRACRDRGIAMPIEAAARVAFLVLEALEYAHGFVDGGRPREVVHGEVSPRSVFIRLDGSVQLQGFGMPKPPAHGTGGKIGGVETKVSYLSPEQVRRQRPDARADLWGVGVTLFEALTNQPLFLRASLEELRSAIVTDPIAAPEAWRPDVPPEVATIVRTALSRDAAERYQGASQMRAALGEALRGRAPDLGAGALAGLMGALFGPPVGRSARGEGGSRDNLRSLFVPLDDGDETTARTSVPPLVSAQGRHAASAPPAEVITAVSRSEGSGAGEEGEGAPVSVPRASSRWALVGAVAAALVLAGGLGGMLARRGRSGHAPPPLVVAPAAARPTPPPPVAPPPPALAAPAPVAGATAPAAAAAAPPPPAPASAPAPATEATGRRPDRSALRPLTTREAAIVFGRARTKLLSCFAEHSASISHDEGEISLSVVVVQSGAVREASLTSAPVGSPELDQCIVDRVKRLQFRSHPDKEIRINVPFVYRVKS